MGKDMKNWPLEELVDRTFEGTFGELVEMSEDDAHRTCEEIIGLFKKQLKGSKVPSPRLAKSGVPKLRSPGARELWNAIRYELNNMHFEFEVETCKKMNLLVKAAFMLGSLSSSDEYSRLARFFRSLRLEAEIEHIDFLKKSSDGGKAKKKNPVLIQAIKNILEKKPSSTQKQIINALKSAAKDPSGFVVNGYDIGFSKKNSVHNDTILKSDSFTFAPSPGEMKEYQKYNPVSVNSVGRYCTRIKNNDW